MWWRSVTGLAGCAALIAAVAPERASAGTDYMPDYGYQAPVAPRTRTTGCADHHHCHHHRPYHYGFTYNYPYVVPYAYHPPSYYRPYYNHHLGFKMYYRPHSLDYGLSWPGVRYRPYR